MSTQAREVIDFWFGEPADALRGQARPMWFQKSDALDTSILERFGTRVEQALGGELGEWSSTASAALAQILLLDQFTRNAFRGTPRAFAGDARALAVAIALVGSHQDEDLPPTQRWFVYMPFEHAESLAMQDESVRLFSSLLGAAPELTQALDYAHRHREVIVRFGRFPHRNAILGRESTADELEFLRQPGSGF